MKKILTSCLLLCSTALSAEGYEIQINPMNRGVGMNDGAYYNDGDYDDESSAGDNRGYMGRSMMRPADVANQLCQAISNQNQIEIVVEKREIVNSKELRVEVKKVVVEPYGLAVTQNGQPVVRGNIVSDKMIKEVTVKFGDDRFDTSKKDKDVNTSSSWFSSSNKNLDISRVRAINPTNTRFDAPKDYKGFEDNSLNVICEIQPVKN